MTRLRFSTFDVFADRRFGGAPVAVVEDGEGLCAAEMAAIAGELRVPAAFLLTPRDAINSARIKVFAADGETGFCGAATIGAAAHLARTRAGPMLARHDVVVALEQETGSVRCEVWRGADGACFARFDHPAPPRRLDDAPQGAALAEALSLAAGDIGFDGLAPTLYEMAREPLLFVPLRSRAALDRAERASGFVAAMGAAAGAFLYARETEDAACAIRARMFPRRPSLPEEPATPSAVAAFAGVALEFERPDNGAHEFFVEQGHGVGRPSRLALRMRVEEGRLAAVGIGGRAAPVCEGVLAL